MALNDVVKMKREKKKKKKWKTSGRKKRLNIVFKCNKQQIERTNHLA